MNESSLLAVLRERASLQPNHPAFTFHDYEHDAEGAADTVTWAQLHRRSHNLALEVQNHTSAGDRAVILAPQGLIGRLLVPQFSVIQRSRPSGSPTTPKAQSHSGT